MKFKHLESELNTVKKYIGRTDKTVFYQDIIQNGYSLKIEYMNRSKENALKTFKKLQKRFPDNNVRILYPSKDRRPNGWHAVRIWVKE